VYVNIIYIRDNLMAGMKNMKNFSYDGRIESQLETRSTAQLQEQVKKEIEGFKDRPLASGISGFKELPHTILGNPYEPTP